ncbi:hypothetical protein ETI27_08795 [Salmonella enterica]|uniref:Uncharacterized protein n=3 Tax=Salmonella enterica TaxID=28901 RepID=A0A5T9MVV1_SALER|nr:hypothetical protein [Salmonella enterica subsp. enterica serovar Panama]EAA1087109.1 hypothetical protein [Salmonella enterica subsp. enterica serovar Durban]EAA9178761.1 hypothetical protein [Salmonella enterica subsp. enterica serovar Javiana]EAB3109236.1 hypothetical protein [Salmonella enterica]EBA0091570.1 hypothetical protein [Salmonella enterica subsp. enterica serovar Enteritidis]EBV6641206.1 hypothetical protein [Salmonella enterica subsp. enterica serovar Pomona]EBW3293758.1 hyp
MPDGGCALSGLQDLQYQYIAMNFCRPDKRSAIRHYHQADINTVGPISEVPSGITTRLISTR